MSEQAQMKLDMVTKLAMLLIEKDSKLDIESALDIVLNSDTYQKILDEKTHLYYQTPRYVLSFLDAELKNGKIAKTQ